MAVQPIRKPASESADQPWRSSLDSLEATLAEAARAITELRLSLEGENAAIAEPAAEQDAPVADEKSERITDFERVWQRLESERKEPAAARVEQDQPNEPGGSGERKEPAAARAEQDQPNEPGGSGERKEPAAARAEQDQPNEPSGAGERKEPTAARVEQDAPAADEKSERITDFERVWQRLESERKEPAAARVEQVEPNEPGGSGEREEPATARAEQDQPNEPSGSGERKEPAAARAEQDQPSEPSGPSESRGSLTDFDRVWQRLERERKETGAGRDEQDDVSEPSGPSEPGEPRGVDLARGIYLMTIEDRDASVDLIMLQRGLLTLAPLEDIRLVTYAKGIPVVSLRIEGKLDLERLGEAVGDATGRRCEVIPQDGAKLFLRLTPNDDQEEAA